MTPPTEINKEKNKEEMITEEAGDTISDDLPHIEQGEKEPATNGNKEDAKDMEKDQVERNGKDKIENPLNVSQGPNGDNKESVTISQTSEETNEEGEANSLPSRSEDSKETSNINNTSNHRNTYNQQQKHYCYPKGCKLNRRKTGDMILCSLCFQFFHHVCTGDDIKELQEVPYYSCPSCRRLPNQVYSIMIQLEKVVELVEKIPGLNTTVKGINKKPAKVTSAPRKGKHGTIPATQSTKNKTRNKRKRNRKKKVANASDTHYSGSDTDHTSVDKEESANQDSDPDDTSMDKEESANRTDSTIHNKNTKESHRKEDLDSSTKKKIEEKNPGANKPQKTYSEVVNGPFKEKTIILGDHNVKYLEVTTPDVCRYSNTAMINDVKDELMSLTSSTNEKVENIILHVGGNDCQTETPIRTMVNEYTELIKVAKPKCRSLTVSSICPIIDDKHTNTRVQTLNAELCVLASDLNCAFVDNRNFYDDTGMPDTEMFYRGSKYLSEKGSAALGSNLGIKTTESNSQSEYSYWREQKHTRPRQNRCWNCGKGNHISNDCYYTARLQCFGCLRYGHKQSDCMYRSYF